jgi:phosphoribosylpyrophosphate synthetase
VKKDKDSDLELVMSYYGYNRQKAKAAIKLLSPNQMKTIKNKLDKGGVKNERSR